MTSILAGGLYAAALLLAPSAHADDETSTPEVDVEPLVPQVQRAPYRLGNDIPMQRPPGPQRELRGDFELLGQPVDLGVYFWVDTGILDRTNGQAGDPNQQTLYMQGRYVLSAAYGAQKGPWFVMARGEIMGLVNEFAKSAYEPHALDAYVRVGLLDWGDITIGRFLGWQVYYRGQGIELFTAEEAGALDAPALYLLDRTRGYRNEAGQVALHLYPAKFLAIEVAGVYGQENNQNNVGVRPVAVFHVGGFAAVAGMEFQHQYAIKENDRVDVKQLGFGGQLRYTAGPVTFGGSAARLDQDRITIEGEADTAASFLRTSAGGFLDLNFTHHAFGAAYHRTWEDNQRDEHETHDQITASYLLRLPFDGLSVKAVYGYAFGDLENIDAGQSWSNNLHSVRMRVSYDLP